MSKKQQELRWGTDISGWSFSELLAISTSPPQPVVGVYFLFRGRRLLYVGESVDIFARVSDHRSHSQIPFDRVSHLKTSPEIRKSVERSYLDKFLPPFNRDPKTRYLMTEGQRHESDTVVHDMHLDKPELKTANDLCACSACRSARKRNREATGKGEPKTRRAA